MERELGAIDFGTHEGWSQQAAGERPGWGRSARQRRGRPRAGARASHSILGSTELFLNSGSREDGFMPLKGYGVLKGTPIRRVLGQRSNPHYHVLEIDEETRYRIAINVFSKEHPSEVEYLIDEHFQHPILEKIHELPHGFTELDDRRPGGINLDFIRMNLFNRDKMVPLPFDIV